MPYRKRNLSLRLREIEERKESELKYLQEQIFTPETSKVDIEEEILNISTAAARARKEALNAYGNGFWRGDTRIAPLRGALATWGLTVDDIAVASFHGTSTKMNDLNESRILNTQMKHLGRTEGNPLLAVFQKSLTGHPKGAAGAWMLNGALQIMDTGLVPGNRNADNIDKELDQFEFVTYPSQNIQTPSIDAVSVTSFGFGQKGAQAVAVNPKFLFATIGEEEYGKYVKKREGREKKAYKQFHQGLTTNKVFVPKDVGPYAKEKEFEFLMDPHARISK